MKQKKTNKFLRALLTVLVVVIAAVFGSAAAFAEEGETEAVIPEPPAMEAEVPDAVIPELPVVEAEVPEAVIPEAPPEEDETHDAFIPIPEPSDTEAAEPGEVTPEAPPAEPTSPAKKAAAADSSEPVLGTAPPMDPKKRPDYKETWADKILPEFGEKVGQYDVKEGEFYVLQTVFCDGKSNRMTKRLVYIDRVYEAPGIIWGTRRTIDYTDANTGEHRTQDISGWSPESVSLFKPEANRFQNKIG